MAQPHKGPRVGVLVRLREDERTVARARAAAVGLTLNDYLVELLRRDPVDETGRPTWAPSPTSGDQLELIA